MVFTLSHSKNECKFKTIEEDVDWLLKSNIDHEEEKLQFKFGVLTKEIRKCNNNDNQEDEIIVSMDDDNNSQFTESNEKISSNNVINILSIDNITDFKCIDSRNHENIESKTIVQELLFNIIDTVVSQYPFHPTKQLPTSPNKQPRWLKRLLAAAARQTQKDQINTMKRENETGKM